jgi:hypothetical protein
LRISAIYLSHFWGALQAASALFALGTGICAIRAISRKTRRRRADAHSVDAFADLRIPAISAGPVGVSDALDE